MKIADSKLILLAQVAAGLMSLISVTISASFVGPAIFAYCSITVLFLTIGMMFIDFGSCAWAARELASSKISIQTYRNVMNSKSQLSLIFLLATPFCVLILDKDKYAIIFLLIYPLLAIRYNYIQQFLITTKKIPLAAILIIVERFFWLLIIPLSLYEVNRVLAYVLPMVIGLLFHELLGIRLMPDVVKNQKGKFGFSQISIFKKSKHFGIISITGLSNLLDGFFVAFFSNLSESGNYLLSQRYRNPAAVIYSSVSIRIRPIAAAKDFKQLRKALRSDAGLLFSGVLLNITFSILLYFFSPILLGTEFNGIELILFLGTLAAIPFGVLLITTSILGSIGAEKFVSKSNLAYTGVIAIGISLSAHFEGAKGAAFFYLGAVSIFAVMYLFVIRFYLKNEHSEDQL